MGEKTIKAAGGRKKERLSAACPPAFSALLGCSSGSDPGNPYHTLNGAQLFDHVSQVNAIVDADDQLHHADAPVALVHTDFFDIAVGGVDAAGEQGDQAALVLQFDA